MTALGTGADIGIGFVIFPAPLAIAGLLYAAVGVHRASGGVQSRYVMWCILAWLVAPFLYVVLFKLPTFYG